MEHSKITSGLVILCNTEMLHNPHKGVGLVLRPKHLLTYELITK
jgi:hypothetical protein